jgi:hypothetical protein
MAGEVCVEKVSFGFEEEFSKSYSRIISFEHINFSGGNGAGSKRASSSYSNFSAVNSDPYAFSDSYSIGSCFTLTFPYGIPVEFHLR